MSETQAAELLAQLARRITASLDLRETLQVVAQAVVDQLGFGAAVVNLCQPGDLCEVAAVAGPDEVGQALLGTRAPMANFRRLLDGCEPWGELRFLDHRKDDGLSRGVAAWSPPGEPRDEPDAWHPEDILLAPLYAPDQTLIGVLSVDIPVDGRRPGRPGGGCSSSSPPTPPWPSSTPGCTRWSPTLSSCSGRCSTARRSRSR